MSKTTTNDIIKSVHRAVLAKVKEQCSVEGSNQVAVDIANEVLGYAKTLAAAFANDGKVDSDEEEKLVAEFDALIDKRVPAIAGTPVELAWNGISIWPFSGMWSGVKSYLVKWFGLAL